VIEVLTHPVVLWVLLCAPLWAALGWVLWRLRRLGRVWDMERRILDEQLPVEARERQRRAQERYAAVQREARRRLGIPEDWR
jgi:hypothetical protein